MAVFVPTREAGLVGGPPFDSAINDAAASHWVLYKSESGVNRLGSGVGRRQVLVIQKNQNYRTYLYVLYP